MSPEQARGEPLDARSDLWSLGVVLYEMLTGELPYRGDSDQVVIHSILNGNVPRPVEKRSDTPAELGRIVAKCMDRDLSKRYQTASELRADLNRLLGDKGRRPWYLTWRGGLAAVAASAVIWTAVQDGPAIFRRWFKPIPKIKVLALLPAEIIGGSEADKDFGIGLVSDLEKTLVTVERFQRSLSVVPVSDIRQKKILSPSQAGNYFHITLALEIIMRRAGDAMEFTLNLVDVKAPRTLRSARRTERLDRAPGPELYASLGLEVIKMLEIEVRPETGTGMGIGRPVDPRAYGYYVQGRGYKDIYDAKAEAEDLNTAIRQYLKALELDPAYALAHAGLAEAYWTKYEDTRDPAWIEMARASCAEAIRSDGRLAPGYITLGIIEIGTGKYEEAIRELDQALSRDPESFDAYLQLGIAYQRLDDFAQAEKNFGLAIRSKPYNWLGYSYLGVLYFLTQRYDDAEKQFREVTELNPDNYNGINCLGGICLATGRLDEARALFEKSLAIKPAGPAYSNLGTIHFMQGKFREATAAFEKAVESGTSDVRILGNLARGYHYAGQEDQARAAFARGIKTALADLAINPRNTTARSCLASFYAGTGDFRGALAAIRTAKEQAPKDLYVLRKSVLVYELAGRRDLALAALREVSAMGGKLEDLAFEPAVDDLLRDARSMGIAF
jgi:Flp pilus assembly protein TadD